jgi:hypothetical protein
MVGVMDVDMEEFGVGTGIVPLSSSSSIVHVSRKSRNGSIREVGDVWIKTCEIIDGSSMRPEHNTLSE